MAENNQIRGEHLKSMMHKLENPKRVEELSPKETLVRIGLSDHSAFCDIGAGAGIFTYAAAEITANDIYAVEISSEMREILQSKNNAPNVAIEDAPQHVPANFMGYGFMPINRFNLGENFYCLVFRQTTEV